MRKNEDEMQLQEKETEGSISDWISGGPMGSKTAVLVFRSCVLASRTPSMESTTKTIGNNTGTTILLNKAKNMARRLVAEPHAFSMRPKHIMHDVMETFGNTNKFNGQAYVVQHVSDSNIAESVIVEEQGHEAVEHKRDIDDVLNDLSKITLKKHLNIENTTANIKPPEEPPPPSVATTGIIFFTFINIFSYYELQIIFSKCVLCILFIFLSAKYFCYLKLNFVIVILKKFKYLCSVTVKFRYECGTLMDQIFMISILLKSNVFLLIYLFRRQRRKKREKDER